MTADGHETNIGKDCGKTYFGVDFEALSKKFDRDTTAAENRERLKSFSFQLEELEHKIAELRRSKYGADWVHKHTRPLLNQNGGCPEEILRRISSMIKTRSNVLSMQRQATEREVENLEAIERRKFSRPHYIDVPIAELIGIEALYPENDLRNLLVLDLETNVKEFREKDIDVLTYEELGHWAKWISSVDITIEKATSVVSQGRKLLGTKNLEPFLRILSSQADITNFQNFLKRLNES